MSDSDRTAAREASRALEVAAPLARVSKSATVAAGERAARLANRGVDVVDLGPGQPDFDTPEHIKEAAVQAIAEGHTKYTPVAGIPELRDAVARRISERDGVELTADETIVTSGGKHALYNALRALLEPGDEVVIPTPYWVTFPEQVRLTGASPVFVDSREEDDFAVRAADIEAACTDATRAIVLNTPSNPTGAVVPRTEVEAITRLAIERDLTVVFDECYADYLYDGAEHVTPFAVGKEARSHCVLCGSCSKTFAMTGWRVGYAVGPRPLVEAMSRFQSHVTSNATSVSQWAALAALQGDQEPVREMLAAFAERREIAVGRLRRMPGVTCAEPRGAFYAFPNVESMLSDEAPTSVDLAMHLLDTVHVATVPGAAFGRDGYLRLSFATSVERLEEGLNRLAEAFAVRAG